MAKRKGGLGRGLDALFADAAPLFEEDLEQNEEENIDTKLLDIIDDVTGDKSRERFDLKSKAKSNKNHKTKSDRDETKGNNLNSTKEDKTPREHAVQLEERNIKDSKGETSQTQADSAKIEADEDRVLYIDINDIKPNKDQPRKTFNEEKLKDLANSIKENGVIQPLIIRKAQNGYELVAGERRWRAARIAEIKKVPCIIRNFDEKQNMIVAIIENMQRENLDPIEEALGLNEMIKRFEFTQEQVSNALGKSRAYIANSLRLLKLPEKIQNMIIEGRISAAHGRTIITIKDEKKQIEVCDKIIRNGLSVRAAERLTEKIKDDARPERKKRKPSVNAEIAAVEDELRKIFGTKVNINGKASTGKIEIEYYSIDELNRLIDMLRGIE
ncbi:MAG: ParB/RepB/Spo0J family partition protein [Mogibacterium diversum]|jgi:stage 0 sporulation protein J|uniref:ParB/RepB/Spo0J family partition protein n=1 Tax=Mogibacterium diversum TaxID=114527 RepID=UPI001CAEC6BD|nr:ParB/RepB/Spo0J family partition protein [Mogibacterium diversum]MBF1319174.1 ParB/RepB/Spo0J family partition protein [Mogibacterium diversum]UQF81405.1 MAG: ParB/RepB/Spo0J family partition protein [Mogibacterium diversum]